MNTYNQKFLLAPMSSIIRTFTWVLLTLPVVFLAIGLRGPTVLLLAGGLVVVVYAWTWLLMRPTQFVVHADRLEIIWPLKRQSIQRKFIKSVRVITVAALREEVGFAMRVGVGGLWGAFGGLWTKKRGMLYLYVSREDGLVWLELVEGQPWLITPERPEEFVNILSH